MSGAGRRSADVNAGQRLKRYQARFEPVVTRVLLLGIFVTGLIAQFVKPVGDALEGKAFLGGALLSLVGYVLYDAVKDLASSAQPPVRAMVEPDDLSGFVSEAFSARTVEICFLGYTGETLVQQICRRLEGLLEDPGPTRRVSVRMLVPDFRQPMTVPSKVGPGRMPEDDQVLRQDLERQCAKYDQDLAGWAQRLMTAGTVTVECEYRLYPGIPRDKICIFNRERVLHGLYDVVHVVAGMPHDPDSDFYDPRGYRTKLSGRSPEDTAPAADWVGHFDGLWSLAAVPHWRRAAVN
jgi:hypothetical protein